MCVCSCHTLNIMSEMRRERERERDGSIKKLNANFGGVIFFFFRVSWNCKWSHVLSTKNGFVFSFFEISSNYLALWLRLIRVDTVNITFYSSPLGFSHYFISTIFEMLNLLIQIPYAFLCLSGSYNLYRTNI